MLSGRRVAYFPTAPTLQNYLALLKDTPFLLYFRNSAIIATGNMLLTLLVASLGAYGFVRFRFPGRSAMLVAMLVAYTIPSVVLLVPLLVIFRSYGLVNTHLGMILAEATHSAPFVLLLMINYFSTLPRELGEMLPGKRCEISSEAWRRRPPKYDEGPRDKPVGGTCSRAATAAHSRRDRSDKRATRAHR